MHANLAGQALAAERICPLDSFTAAAVDIFDYATRFNNSYLAMAFSGREPERGMNSSEFLQAHCLAGAAGGIADGAAVAGAAAADPGAGDAGALAVACGWADGLIQQA